MVGCPYQQLPKTAAAAGLGGPTMLIVLIVALIALFYLAQAGLFVFFFSQLRGFSAPPRPLMAGFHPDVRRHAELSKHGT